MIKTFSIQLVLILISFGKTYSNEKAINIYKNGQLESINYIDSTGKLSMQIYLYSNAPNDTFYFHYKKHFLDDITIKGGSKELEKDFYLNYYKDIESNVSSLYRDSIFIPDPFINSSSIKDISLFLSLKKHTKKYNDNTRTFLFESLNTKIRFYPSDLEDFFQPSTIINSYTLKLNRNGFIVSERIISDECIFSRKYFYEENKLVKIELIGTYPQEKKKHIITKIYKYE